MGLAFTETAERAENRVPVLGAVSFSYGKNTEQTSLQGATVNLSASGLSFYTHEPLIEGLTINVSGERLWEGLKPATVKWCVKAGEDIYRVGAAFH